MTRYALVIGIAQYDNFRSLPKAAMDAAAIVQVLRDHGKYEVLPLPAHSPEKGGRLQLARNQPLTGKMLGQELEKFFAQRAVNHEALIYFAGHGFEVPGLGGQKKGHLATSDSHSDGHNAIAFQDLNYLIAQSKFSSLVLMLDCCHAGSFLERTLLDSSLTAFKEKQDYYLMTACRSFELAREAEQHGVFTAAVLKGLQLENADNDGNVTGDRLFDSIQRDLRQTGQEPIRTGTGRSITLVSYQPQVKAVKAIVDEEGKVICPYQGLQAFTAQQREFFFGRKQTVEAIKQGLGQKPFVPVIGASGSGKSSVVRAGLMPWLEESGWHILAPIKPGFEPLLELRGAFKSFFEGKRGQQLKVWLENREQYPQGFADMVAELPSNGKFLLVVDQFEEVFTVCADETERQRFIELITQVTEIANSRLAVVTTMRADFLEPCLRYAALHHLIQTQAVLMPPFTGVDLRDAIVEPAKRQGYEIEEPLLLKLIEDVGRESGSLPLLEFTLTKLWEKRDNTRQLLALVEYEKLGGLSGALNLHAEKVYRYQDYEEEIPTKERTALEQGLIQRIFLRLIRTGQGDNDTRQRQLKTKLLALATDDPEAQQLLNQLLNEDSGLVQGRLLVAGKNDQQAEWIDLAHEALIGGWQRYAEWRNQDRELRRLTDQVDDALRNWEEQSQRDDFLMPRGLVKQVTKRWSELQPYLSKAAQEFYQCSYDHDREKTSYESDINHFKGQLQELQMNLTERLEQIAKLRELRESREADNSQNRPPAESPNIEETASLDNPNQAALVRLRDEVDRFLGRAQRFEERMQAANSAADWIGSHQATIVDVIVQYSLTNSPQNSDDEMPFNHPENVQKYYGEINRYLDWLQESLRRGQPLVDQIDEIPISLPRDIYTEAFKLIKQEWESSDLSNSLIQEIQPYLKYLIAYFEYGE